MSPDDAVIDFAAKLALRGGEVARKHFRRQTPAENKSDNTVVTRADRESETAMRQSIAAAFPRHGIVGEEFGETNPGQSETWVLDPVDGTLSFVTGSPLFCALVAFVRDGVPVVGVVHLPATGDLWIGAGVGSNPGATFNGNPCRVSRCADFSRAACAVTTVGWQSGKQDDAMKKMLAAAGRVRLGGDGFNYGCVASGFADLAADYDMAPHDYLAPAALVSAAGGVMTDWKGNPLALHSGKTEVVAACTPEVHRAALDALS